METAEGMMNLGTALRGGLGFHFPGHFFYLSILLVFLSISIMVCYSKALKVSLEF